MYRGKMKREKITYEVKLKRPVFARRKKLFKDGGWKKAVLMTSHDT